MKPEVPNHSAPVPPPRDYQEVVNRSWPLSDSAGRPHARGIPDRDPIDVTIRVTWQRDGEEHLEARAVRWTDSHVCVYLDDARLQVPYLWVRAADVTRR